MSEVRKSLATGRELRRSGRDGDGDGELARLAFAALRASLLRRNRFIATKGLAAVAQSRLRSREKWEKEGHRGTLRKANGRKGGARAS